MGLASIMAWRLPLKLRVSSQCIDGEEDRFAHLEKEQGPYVITFLRLGI